MPIVKQNVLSRQKFGTTTRLGNRVPMQRSAFTLRSPSQQRSSAQPYDALQTQPSARPGMQGTPRNVTPSGTGEPRGGRSGTPGTMSPGGYAMQGRVADALGRYGRRSAVGAVAGVQGVAAAALSPVNVGRLGYDIAQISRDINALNNAFGARGISNPALARSTREMLDIDPSYDPSSPVGRSRTDTALDDPMGLSPASNTPNPELSRVGRMAGRPSLADKVKSYFARDESVSRDVETGITPTSRQYGYRDPKMTGPPARSPQEDAPVGPIGALDPKERDDPTGLNGLFDDVESDAGPNGRGGGPSGSPGSGDDTDTTGVAESQSDAQAAENEAQGGGGGGGDDGDGSWFCTAVGIAREDVMVKFRRMAEIYYPEPLQYYVDNGPRILERMDSKALKAVLRFINKYVVRAMEKEDFDAAFFLYAHLVLECARRYLPEKVEGVFNAITLARAQWLEDMQTQS